MQDSQDMLDPTTPFEQAYVYTFGAQFNGFCFEIYPSRHFEAIVKYVLRPGNANHRKVAGGALGMALTNGS